MAVLTISRTYGCGAREMARELAKKLDYTLFEKEIVLMLAKKLDRKTTYTLEHDEFRDMLSSSVIDSVSSRFAFLKKNSISPQEYAKALKDIFLELTRQGNIIFVGRGSQFILQGQPDIFHIRLVASMEDRIKHLKENHFLILSDDALIQRVKAEDRRRREFLKTHFHQNGEDPLIYHITINLSKISRAKAQETILQLIGQNSR